MMKKMLLILLALPNCVFAQKFEVAVLGGGSLNATKAKYWDKPASFTPFLTTQLAYNMKKSSVGVKTDFYYVPYTYSWYAFTPDNQKIEGEATHRFSPAINLSVFANYLIKADHFMVYFGPSVGFLNTPESTLKVTPKEYESYVVKPEGASSGITVGAQAGASIELSRDIIVKFELAPRYFMSQKAFGKNDDGKLYHSFSLPISAGFAFRF